MRKIISLIHLARPSHWIKNVFVLAALVFSGRVTDPAASCLSLAAFLVFGLASSAMYALNDVIDRREDAHHPAKRGRPVAAGLVSPNAALIFSLVLQAVALGVAALLPWPFVLTVAAYLALTMLYAMGLKRLAVLDVLTIATGFVIRAYAGGVVIGVEVSPWLILCTLTLALFLALAKRESERAALGEMAAETRPVDWEVYDEKSLVHMMTVSAALAIATYMLYTVSPETIGRVGHPWMCLTVLPVVYAVFRFYRLAITGRATDPVEMVRRDPAFVVALVVWVAMVAALLFVLPGPRGAPAP